jgi:hypothetical protein
MPQRVSKREMQADDDAVSGARSQCNGVGAIRFRSRAVPGATSRRMLRAAEVPPFLSAFLAPITTQQLEMLAALMDAAHCETVELF